MVKEITLSLVLTDNEMDANFYFVPCQIWTPFVF